MQRMILTFLWLVSLTGCALSPYGNYATTSLAVNQQLADTTVEQLVRLYPPAQTRVLLRQPITDAFGTRLIQGLRIHGYAVQESGPETMTDRGGPSLDLYYVVDTPLPTPLYRITLWMGCQSLSRAFTVASDGHLSPVGAWVHKVL